MSNLSSEEIFQLVLSYENSTKDVPLEEFFYNFMDHIKTVKTLNQKFATKGHIGDIRKLNL